MDDTALKSLLDSSRTVAIVGLSTDPEKTSSKIAGILIDAGYEVIPVHPKAETILGRTAYPSLAEIPVPVDIVDVFRPAEEAAGVAEQAVAIGAKTLWLQLGIASEQARSIAEGAGMQYVEDACIGATTNRLGNRAAGAAA
jgi:predicted CoA-binding protein